jgi:hypothetical protein
MPLEPGDPHYGDGGDSESEQHRDAEHPFDERRHRRLPPVDFVALLIEVGLSQARDLGGNPRGGVPAREDLLPEEVKSAGGLLRWRPTEERVERVPIALDLQPQGFQLRPVLFADGALELGELLLHRAALLQQLAAVFGSMRVGRVEQVIARDQAGHVDSRRDRVEDAVRAAVMVVQGGDGAVGLSRAVQRADAGDRDQADQHPEHDQQHRRGPRGAHTSLFPLDRATCEAAIP